MKPAVLVTTLFLVAVAALHVWRLVFQIPVAAGEVEVPMWVSVAAVIATNTLAFWLWRENGG